MVIDVYERLAATAPAHRLSMSRLCQHGDRQRGLRHGYCTHRNHPNHQQPEEPIMTTKDIKPNPGTDDEATTENEDDERKAERKSMKKNFRH